MRIIHTCFPGGILERDPQGVLDNGPGGFFKRFSREFKKEHLEEFRKENPKRTPGGIPEGIILSYKKLIEKSQKKFGRNFSRKS